MREAKDALGLMYTYLQMRETRYVYIYTNERGKDALGLASLIQGGEDP